MKSYPNLSEVHESSFAYAQSVLPWLDDFAILQFNVSLEKK